MPREEFCDQRVEEAGQRDRDEQGQPAALTDMQQRESSPRPAPAPPFFSASLGLVRLPAPACRSGIARSGRVVYRGPRQPRTRRRRTCQARRWRPLRLREEKNSANCFGPTQIPSSPPLPPARGCAYIRNRVRLAGGAILTDARWAAPRDRHPSPWSRSGRTACPRPHRRPRDGSAQQ